MAASQRFKRIDEIYKKELACKTEKYKVLRDLDVFVLDNSIRESTVGQLRGHTTECKWQIYNEVKKCGFKHTIVASFSHMARVDDVFIQQLVDNGEDKDGLWAFSEITEGSKNKIPDTESIPIGLKKLKETGLYNVILEIDLGDAAYDFKKFTVEKMCLLIKKWILWIYNNLHKNAKILINFRDLPDAMASNSVRVLQVTDFLCKLNHDISLFGLIFEDPGGKALPEECGTWTKYIRRIMTDNKWKGHLLIHIHEKFGYCDVSTMEVLMSGADGLWSSICMEGASMGNASTCVTLINLIRLGNKKILKRYNCTYLRRAAINVTRITTGEDPPTKQPVYGKRALDFTFDLNKEEFDLADFFGEEAPIRITTLSSPEMIRTKLVKTFGENDQFTDEVALRMKEVMLEDLRANRKEEYMSECGLAILFDRAGGSLTSDIRDIIAKDEIKSPHAQHLIAEIRRRWDIWDQKDEVQGDEKLEFFSFYNGFMAPYFACYRCTDTLKGIKALDMDSDGYIDWNEFLVYLKWAIHQYPDSKTADDVLDNAFRKGLIPAMRDEILNQN